MVSNICYFIPGNDPILRSISLFKRVETQPPTSYTWFYPGGFLLKSLHLSLVQGIRDKADVLLFSSSGKSGWNLSPFGRFPGWWEQWYYWNSPRFWCCHNSPEVMECRLWSGKVFLLLEKDSLNFQKQESNEFPCGKKRARGTWVKQGCLRVFWS